MAASNRSVAYNMYADLNGKDVGFLIIGAGGERFSNIVYQM
ncbi:MAG: hypothetical protein QXN53_07870 [Thermoproteota archaeon]